MSGVVIGAAAAASFLSGSLLFSYWLGRLKKQNLKELGDGNPGALNLWRTAGMPYGLAGILLDFLKGYGPILWLAHDGSIGGLGLLLSAAAAILGHMFSPFTGWRGGKAIAVTFGVWSALTAFKASLAYACILGVLKAAFLLISRGKPSTSAADGVQVVAGMLLLAAFLLAASFPGELAVFAGVNGLLLAFAHRRELRRYLAPRRKKRLDQE